MQEFDHIEAIWAQHDVDVKISADEMLKQAKKEVNSIKTKSLLNIVGMALSIVAIAVLWLFFDFKSITTHIGISIVILAIAIYTFILYKNYKTLTNTDFTRHPADFIADLKSYQIQRYKIYSKLYWFYMIALSIGMILYFFEILMMMSVPMQILTWVITFGWVVFCSTLVRKAVIKKDKERITLLIDKFERINNQFNEPK
ncbi:hypothetical protein [Pedobacter montanisoli]|uniref:Uncharacterized protein n=1 Tax=Pedobacter montanisoli TaxID=2923277 RepID=A0ABS9ZXT7_9SPHI|nr:hypothetical protein [Pedobacter montanisoli]MCJ0743100.1 hypothetical protein [Pedobacter montanisoli]